MKSDKLWCYLSYGSENFLILYLSIYLNGFQTNETISHDKLHGLNGLASYHDDQIKQAIEALKKKKRELTHCNRIS